MTIPGVTTHARERMAEHHGRDLTLEEWLRVVGAILDRTTTLLRSHVDGAEVHLYQGCGVPLRFIWRPSAGAIVTVLAAEVGVSKIGDKFRRGRVRSSIRMGKGYYDREGNRI